MRNIKGIILAGGRGSRLFPLTISLSKQLLPVLDKPMIFYPLTTLILAGITEIGVVVDSKSRSQFEQLLGDGSDFGISISFFSQEAPLGLAHALYQTRQFVEGSEIMVILGDNLFYGPGAGESLEQHKAHNLGARLFCKRVKNPQEYGVVELDSQSEPLSIEEKPAYPKSSWAATGLYIYDQTAMSRIEDLKPSPRNELEISDLNQSYLNDGLLKVEKLMRSTAWLDTGTIAGLREASRFVDVVEHQHGLKIGCPEEAAWRKGHLTNRSLIQTSQRYGSSDYGAYLKELPLRDGF